MELKRTLMHLRLNSDENILNLGFNGITCKGFKTLLLWL